MTWISHNLLLVNDSSEALMPLSQQHQCFTAVSYQQQQYSCCIEEFHCRSLGEQEAMFGREVYFMQHNVRMMHTHPPPPASGWSADGWLVPWLAPVVQCTTLAACCGVCCIIDDCKAWTWYPELPAAHLDSRLDFCNSRSPRHHPIWWAVDCECLQP